MSENSGSDMGARNGSQDSSHKLVARVAVGRSFAGAAFQERVLFGQLASAALDCNDLPPLLSVQ